MNKDTASNTTGGVMHVAQTGGDSNTMAAEGDGGMRDAGADASGPKYSEYCGDGIVGPDVEECDDGPDTGNSADDACSDSCEYRFSIVDKAQSSNSPDGGVSDGRTLHRGYGPHNVAATEDAIMVAYLEASPTQEVYLQPLTAQGQRAADKVWLSELSLPTAAANPSVAALPGGDFAVVWTDSSVGTPDIWLQRVTPEGDILGAAIVVNDGSAGAQENPDAIWAKDSLIIAYTDLVDVRMRRYDENLEPLAGEENLAYSDAIENDVVLCALENPTAADKFAAAYRSVSAGLQSVVVRVGNKVWETEAEPFAGQGDRPALVSLDEATLVLAYTVGTDPSNIGDFGVSRVRLTLVDLATPGILSGSPLPVETDEELLLGQSNPSLAASAGHLYLAFEQATAIDAIEEADVYSVEVTVAADQSITLDAWFDLPAFMQEGADRNPNMAATPLFPSGAVTILLEHEDRAQGTTELWFSLEATAP